MYPVPGHRCSGKFLPAVKFVPPPVTLPSVLSAVCIAHNNIDTWQIVYLSYNDPCPKISIHKSEIKVH